MTNREKIIRINEIAVRCINAGPADSLETGIENIREIVNGVTLDELREVLLKLRAARGPEAVEQRYHDYMTEVGDLAEHLREVPPYHYEDLYRAVKCDVIDAEVLAPEADRDCAPELDAEWIRTMRSRLYELAGQAVGLASSARGVVAVEEVAMGAEAALEAFDEIFAPYLKTEKKGN